MAKNIWISGVISPQSVKLYPELQLAGAHLVYNINDNDSYNDNDDNYYDNNIITAILILGRVNQTIPFKTQVLLPLPSQKLTYPTLGIGQSSTQQVPKLVGDMLLGGCFKYILSSSPLREMIQFDSYCSTRLKPPIS